jgi:hypothetical protein
MDILETYTRFSENKIVEKVLEKKMIWTWKIKKLAKLLIF